MLVNNIIFTPYKINPGKTELKEESGEADKSEGKHNK